MSIGDKASLAAARIMAGLGHDVLTDPALLAAAKADLAARTAGYTYVSPIPADRTGPRGLPDYMHKGQGEDTLVPEASDT